MKATTVSSRAENALREMIRVVVNTYHKGLRGHIVEAHPSFSSWYRGSDGHYRSKPEWRMGWGTKLPEVLRSNPELQPLIQSFESDNIVARHLGQMVTSATGGSRLESESIYGALMHSMFDENGMCAFRDDVFNAQWSRIKSFLEADKLLHKLVVPLPGLRIVEPLEFAEGVVIDVLTGPEVGRCVVSGILTPLSYGSPMIFGEHGVGVRITRHCNKYINGRSTSEGATGLALPEHFDVSDSVTLANSIVSALRLQKACGLIHTGWIAWTDAWSLDSAINFVPGASIGRLQLGKHELSCDERAELINIWKRVQSANNIIPFSIRRFHLAFDRHLPEDRLVDLVIAAESLLLSDTNKEGELSFRVALRAAKLIKHPKYTPQEVYRLMKTAYGVRSAVVHSGKPLGSTPLPDNKDATMLPFMLEVENVVRLCIKSAIGMPKNGAEFKDTSFWDKLVIG